MTGDGLEAITPEEAAYIASLTDAASAVLGPEPDADATPDAIEAHGPSDGLVGEPAGPGPYYLREWRGSALYGCPDGDFTSRTSAGVERHRAIVHTPDRALSLAERAARAGIIVAKR